LHVPGRRLAFQALFEAEFGRTTAANALAREVASRPMAASEQRFADALIGGVVREQRALDATIAEIAPAQPIARMGVVDRVVLRIALYELLFNNAATPSAGLPVGAVINEAVELAKTYGSDGSRRLVNGVLGTVSRERLSPPDAETPDTEAGD
jgi:N utilization substance protein B